MKHWARNLPEAGNPVKYRVRHFENLSLEIERLKKEIIRLEEERKLEELEIVDFVSSEWSKEEIDKAKGKK